ncbi:hypothetical protein CK203_054550 [Vitis vinifera]|uniref:Wall-associated receptor kinase galacturonan-binding domain-containing protein n=1 Tax=Vitis vinifera TaxID=29760 RepID=A0A438GQI1_VITVI|nr:hypothetical protein CK203_054550 [Vitis vinifera]
MMLREENLVGVGLLTILHVCFLSVCVADKNQTFKSSCGDMNISDPFYLEDDYAPNLGHHHLLKLICENNRTMVNLNFSGKYHVADINYSSHTIRFSLHAHGRSLVTRFIISIFLSFHATRIGSSPFSQPYAYAIVGDLELGDIPDSCILDGNIVTQSKAVAEGRHLSMSDLQEELLMGFELSFLYSICDIECEVKGLSCDPNFISNTFKCYNVSAVEYCWDFVCLKPKWIQTLIINLLHLIGYIVNPSNFTIEGLKQGLWDYYFDNDMRPLEPGYYKRLVRLPVPNY